MYGFWKKKLDLTKTMSFSLFWDFSYDILKLFCQAVKSVNNVVAKINAKTIMEMSIQQLLEEHVKDGTAKVHTHTTHWNLSKRNLPRELSYHSCYYFCLGQCLCLFLCTLNCKLTWGNSSVTGKGQKCKKIEKYSILMRLKSE